MGKAPELPRIGPPLFAPYLTNGDRLSRTFYALCTLNLVWQVVHVLPYGTSDGVPLRSLAQRPLFKEQFLISARRNIGWLLRNRLASRERYLILNKSTYYIRGVIHEILLPCHSLSCGVKRGSGRGDKFRNIRSAMDLVYAFFTDAHGTLLFPPYKMPSPPRYPFSFVLSISPVLASPPDHSKCRSAVCVPS